MIFGDHGSEEPSSSVKVDAWLNPRLETAAAVNRQWPGTAKLRCFTHRPIVVGLSRGMTILLLFRCHRWALVFFATLGQRQALRAAKSFGGCDVASDAWVEF